MPGHTFTAFDVSARPPDARDAARAYDEILLFEDTLFAKRPRSATVVYAVRAIAGAPVILGDVLRPGPQRPRRPGMTTPHGWGALESIDPNTTDTFGATPSAAHRSIRHRSSRTR